MSKPMRTEGLAQVSSTSVVLKPAKSSCEIQLNTWPLFVTTISSGTSVPQCWHRPTGLSVSSPIPTLSLTLYLEDNVAAVPVLQYLEQRATGFNSKCDGVRVARLKLASLSYRSRQP